MSGKHHIMPSLTSLLNQIFFDLKVLMCYFHFVDILLRLARYYSMMNNHFNTIKYPNSKAKMAGKSLAKKAFSKNRK